MAEQALQTAGRMAGFSRIREILAEGARLAEITQRRILELQSEPPHAKTLRAFTAGEAAEILGLSDGHLRALVRDREDFPKGTEGPGGRRSFLLSDIHGMLRTLRQETGDARYRRGRVGAEKLQIVAVANFKGGAAKTTTAVHLGQYLALRGYRVLLIDLDSQGSLTGLFGMQPDIDVRGDQTIYPLYRGEISHVGGLPRPTHWPGLDLIPASLELYQAEFEAPVRRQRDPTFRFWRVLERGILDAGLPHDVVICDCPPSLGFLSIGALFAATSVLVPAPPSMIDFASTGAFFRMTGDVFEEIEKYDPAEKAYDFFKVAITKFDTADNNHRHVANLMAGNFGDMMLERRMATTTMLDAAGLRKMTFYEIDPATPGIARKTRLRALAYLNGLNHEIETLLWKAWGRTAAPPSVIQDV